MIKIQKNNMLKINYNFFQRFLMLVALEPPRAFWGFDQEEEEFVYIYFGFHGIY